MSYKKTTKLKLIDNLVNRICRDTSPIVIIFYKFLLSGENEVISLDARPHWLFSNEKHKWNIDLCFVYEQCVAGGNLWLRSTRRRRERYGNHAWTRSRRNTGPVIANGLVRRERFAFLNFPRTPPGGRLLKWTLSDWCIAQGGCK